MVYGNMYDNIYGIFGGVKMTKEEFENKRIKYLQLQGNINMKLRKKISLDDALKIHEITLEELEVMGFGYDKESNSIQRMRYVSYNDIAQAEGIQESPSTEIITMSGNDLQMYDIFKNEGLDQLKEIINNYSVLMEIIKAYKSKGNIDLTDKSIVIELPHEDDKLFKATYRVNKVIHEQFKEFCSKHKEFTTKDLLSQAMKEFMGKYR